MLTADKVTELFRMADDFCEFFDKMTEKYTLENKTNALIIANPPFNLEYRSAPNRT